MNDLQLIPSDVIRRVAERLVDEGANLSRKNTLLLERARFMCDSEFTGVPLDDVWQMLENYRKNESNKNAARRCALCYKPRASDVHHRTYERFKNENTTDCILLCRQCHDMVENSKRKIIVKADVGNGDDNGFSSMNDKRAGGAVVAHPLFHAGGGGSTPTSALQLTLVEVDMWTAAELNAGWHSMLPRTDIGNLLCGNTSVAYAAEFGGMYYAVGIWSRPIIRSMCDGRTIELRRLAICDDAPANSASRMLAILARLVKRKYPQMTRAISYLAIDRHSGAIYRAAGWLPVGKISDARPQRMTGEHGGATGPLQTTSRKQRYERPL